MYIYKSREKGSVDISSLINELRKIKTLEKNIATNDTKKLVIYHKKWQKILKAIKKHNIRNSTHETIPYIEHLCFYIGEWDGKWKVNIYGQKNIYILICFFVFSFSTFFFVVVVVVAVFNLVFT